VKVKIQLVLKKCKLVFVKSRKLKVRVKAQKFVFSFCEIE